MPGYHVVMGASAEGDTMEVHCSINKTTMESYVSNLPIGEFKFPMGAMTRNAGTTIMNYEGLLEHLQTKPYWYIARIYKQISGNLDMYIRWSYAERVHLFVLEFDPLMVEIGDDYELWPTPRDWYLARAAIRTATSWTLPEYEAMNQPYPAAIDDVPIAADIPATIEAAIEEGGTVFLRSGLFPFFIFPRPGFPCSFIIVRLFPVLGFLSFPHLVSDLIISTLLLPRFSTNASWSLVSTNTFGFN